jgi:hypothetical protein
MATPQGIRENIYRPMDYFNMATMARKWFDSAGYEGVQKIADEAKAHGEKEAANGD